MRRVRNLAIVTSALMAACGVLQPAASTYPLPTSQIQSDVCGGIGGGFVILRGDINDPHLTWETSLDGSGRQEIVWPPGYRARFNPKLEVLDPAGAVIARDGDHVPAGACAVGPPENPPAVVEVQPQDWPR